METTYNPEIKTSRIFVDKFYMTMNQNPSWDPNGDFGEGDSIGRTLDAYIAWKDPQFIEAVKLCFVYKTDENGDTYIQGFRHPNRLNVEYNDMSRDHTLYMLIFMKLVNDPFLDELVQNLRWEISDRFNFTPDLWLYMMAINGYRFDRFLWYTIAIPVQFLSILWNKIVFFVGGFKDEVPQDEFKASSPSDLSKWKLWWREKVYPFYTLAQMGFQLYVMPDTFGKRVVQKICLWGTPSQNFLMKLFFGGKVTREEVYNYKSMTGGRWTTILNEVGRRGPRIITDPKQLEANVLDVDLVRALFEELSPA